MRLEIMANALFNALEKAKGHRVSDETKHRFMSRLDYKNLDDIEITDLFYNMSLYGVDGYFTRHWNQIYWDLPGQDRAGKVEGIKLATENRYFGIIPVYHVHGQTICFHVQKFEDDMFHMQGFDGKTFNRHAPFLQDTKHFLNFLTSVWSVNFSTAPIDDF